MHQTKPVSTERETTTNGHGLQRPGNTRSTHAFRPSSNPSPFTALRLSRTQIAHTPGPLCGQPLCASVSVCLPLSVSVTSITLPCPSASFPPPPPALPPPISEFCGTFLICALSYPLCNGCTCDRASGVVVEVVVEAEQEEGDRASGTCVSDWASGRLSLLSSVAASYGVPCVCGCACGGAALSLPSSDVDGAGATTQGREHAIPCAECRVPSDA